MFNDSLHGLVMQRTLNARALLTDRAGGGLHGDEPAAAAVALFAPALSLAGRRFWI